MRVPETITTYGYTGAKGELGSMDDLRGKLFALEQERHPDGYPDEETQTHGRARLFDEIVSAWYVAQFHNGIAPLIRDYLAAIRKAYTAGRAADEAYDELGKRTTTAWHAAHHRYIIALDAAEAAYAELAQAVTRLSKFHADNWRGIVSSFYNRHVPAGQRIDLAELTLVVEHRNPEHELTLFRERHRPYLRLLNYTLTGGYPAGYEPDPTPTAATEQADETNRSDW